MIISNVSILMGRDRLKIQDVCNKTGLARNTVANLYFDRAARIDYSTLSILCELFQCSVGEILEYVPDQE